MHSGEPFISVETVRAALDHAVYTSGSRRPEADALSHLMLVETFCADPDLPASPHLRDYAVQEVLNSLIIDALNAQRQVFALPPLPPLRTQADALYLVRQDAVRGDDLLLGWDWLYVRFVRVDLALAPDDFAGVASITVRTLNRYQQRAVELLTQRLVAAEWDARRQMHRQRLVAALPVARPQIVVGRAPLFDAALRAGLPLHVTGESGIGKTLLVQEVLRQHLEAFQFDEILWIRAPDSVDAVEQQLQAHLLPDDSRLTLRQFLLLYETAVVLDAADSLLGDPPALADLLRRLSPAAVYLTTTDYTPCDAVGTHLWLPPLNDAETRLLLQHLGADPDALDWQRTGGNPRRLRLLVHAAARAETHETPRHLWHRLSDACRALWLTLTLFGVQGVPRRLWDPLDVSPADLQILADAGLLHDWGDDTVALTDSARAALVESVLRGEAGSVLARVIARLDVLSPTLPADLLPAVEFLLDAFPAQIDEILRARWLDTFLPHALRLRRWALWAPLLRAAARPDQPAWSIAWALCLRRLGQWRQAADVLSQVVADTGQQGAFLMQGQALCALAALYRRTGDYRQARHCLERAYATAERFHDDELRTAAACELAQIALDARTGAAALDILAPLPETARVLAMRGEARYLMGDSASCRALCLRALETSDTDPEFNGKLSTLLGRCSTADPHAAHGWFARALTLLEQTRDPFLLARAQTNLAAHLIEHGTLHEAHTLLLRAEQTQRILGDAPALEVTRHNLSLVTRRTALDPRDG